MGIKLQRKKSNYNYITRIFKLYFPESFYNAQLDQSDTYPVFVRSASRDTTLRTVRFGFSCRMEKHHQRTITKRNLSRRNIFLFSSTRAGLPYN